MKRQIRAMIVLLLAAAMLVACGRNGRAMGDLSTTAQASGAQIGSDEGFGDAPQTAAVTDTVKVLEKYGAKIYWGREGTAFPSPSFTASPADNAASMQAVEVVTGYLASLPEGMIDEMLSGVAKEFCVYICSGLRTNPDLGWPASGFSDNVDGELFVVVNTDDIQWLRNSFAHELWHAIEHRITMIDRSFAGDWLKAQPDEIQKLYWDLGSQRLDSQWTQDGAYCADTESDTAKVWFTRDYSRSDPAEDRATVFENMSDRTSMLLNYPHLMDKAETLCAAIRANYKCCAEAKELPWEAYLENIEYMQSAYTKKDAPAEEEKAPADVERAPDVEEDIPAEETKTAPIPVPRAVIPDEFDFFVPAGAAGSNVIDDFL